MSETTTESAATQRWSSAYQNCQGVLTFLAATQTEKDLETVGTAWKMCMGTALCRPQRYKMPWVYGIAATLPPCVELASSWASRARMPNKGSPLEGFEKTNWDPTLNEWQNLESCVNYMAEKAATSVDNEWESREGM
eukprot:gene2343-531_t